VTELNLNRGQSDDHVREWQNIKRELQEHRAQQQRDWNGVTDDLLARFFLGQASPEERRHIEAARNDSGTPKVGLCLEMLELVLASPAAAWMSEKTSWTVSLRGWLDGLRGAAASAQAWAASLVKGLIEQAGMACPDALGLLGTRGPVLDVVPHQPALTEARAAAGLLETQNRARLTAPEGLAVTLSLPQAGGLAVEVRSEQGELSAPPRVRFLKGEDVVLEVVGRLEQEAGRVVVSAQDLNNARNEGATDVAISV
jgi:hypothetical protein